MSQTSITPGLPGAEERAERGPVLRKGIGPPQSGWFDPRGRAIGTWAFSVNRITGLGLVFYLYLHLGVLSMLLAGESMWNDFLKLATTVVFLLLDVLLLFGILFHGLNGVRVALVGTGIVPQRQRALFWAGTVIGTLLLVAGAIHILGRAEMATVAPTRPRPTKRRPVPGGKSVRAWWWTVITGAALLLLLVVHMIAHHFVVEEVGGLRTYQQVLEYIGNPVIFTIECFFLVTVTTHALLGLRSVLYDMGFGARGKRRIDVGLWVLGLATVAYGFFLVGTLASRA